MRNTLLVLITVVFIGFFSRLIPHASNFTPVIAMALLAGIFAKARWVAIALPLAGMYLSDIVLNNTLYAQYYDGFYLGADPAVYTALILVTLLPAFAKTTPSASWIKLLGTGIGGSFLFFLISNFGTWLLAGIYPLNSAGLIACYTAALPFFQNTLIGTLLFGTLGIFAVRSLSSSENSLQTA